MYSLVNYKWNDIFKKSIKNKLKTFIRKGFNLEQKKQSLDKLALSIDTLITEISKLPHNKYNLSSLKNFLKSNSDIRKLCAYYKINITDVINWKYNNKNWKIREIFSDISYLFKIKQEFKSLKSNISNKLNNISIQDLDDEFIDSVLKDLQDKNVKDFLQGLDKAENIDDFVNNIDISKYGGINGFNKIIKLLFLLQSSQIITLQPGTIKDLRKKYTYILKEKFLTSSILNNTDIKGTTTWSLLHMKKEAFEVVNMFDIMEYLANPKKMLEKMNKDVAFKWLLTTLLKFPSLTQNLNESQKQEVWEKLKKSFKDFKDKDWYRLLTDDEKIQFDFIKSILDESNSYQEYLTNLDKMKIKQERWMKVLQLIDIYKKALVWKWIEPKKMQELTGYLIEWKIDSFVNSTAKLLDHVTYDAEGWVDYDGYEIYKVLFNDKSKLWVFNLQEKLKNLLINWWVFNNKTFFDLANELIQNCENEWTWWLFGNSWNVKKNLLENNVWELITDAFFETVNKSWIKVKKWQDGSLVYTYNKEYLTLKEDGSATCSSQLDALENKFSELEKELKFWSMSIEKSNWEPNWYKDRFKEIFPNLDSKKEYKNIKIKFQQAYYLIAFYQKEGLFIPKELINAYSNYSYILFWKVSFPDSWLQLNDKLSDSYNSNETKEEIEEQMRNNDSIMKKINNNIDELWKNMDDIDREILCKAFKANCKNSTNSSAIPPRVRQWLQEKCISNIYIKAKSRYYYMLLNSKSNELLTNSLNEIIPTKTEQFISFVDNILNEILPIVMAEVAWALLDLTWVGTWFGVVLQDYWFIRMARLYNSGLKMAQYGARYAVVEPLVYTFLSNYLNWEWLSSDWYVKNSIFFLLPGAFAKVWMKMWSFVTKGIWTEVSGISKALWAWWAAIWWLELTNALINWNFDISQIPNDALFLLLLHWVRKWWEMIKTRYWIDITWLVFNGQKRWEIIKKFRDFGVSIKSEIKDLWKILNLYKLTGELKWKKLIFEEGNTRFYKDKEWKVYRVAEVKEKGKTKLELKEIDWLNNVDTMVYIDLKNKTYVYTDKNWNLLIKKWDDTSTINDFIKDGKVEESKITEFEEKIEDLELKDSFNKVYENPKVVEFNSFLELYSNNKQIKQVLENTQNITDVQVKKLSLYKRLKSAFEKKWLSKSEAEQKAVSITKDTVKKTSWVLLSLLKLPFTFAGKILKYSIYASLVWWWVLAYDYYWDKHLDSVDWLKKHLWAVWWAAAGYALTNWKWFWTKLVATVWATYLWNEIQKNWLWWTINNVEWFVWWLWDELKKQF